MIYNVRVNQKLKYVRVYRIVKRLSKGENGLTKLFVKLFAKKGNTE
ncbi:hypothetical protein [Candidatus Mancarchaeum acidiphilum]|nr:hypothetical protein [Candidatus Mancarchaeum acidiphilum]